MQRGVIQLSAAEQTKLLDQIKNTQSLSRVASSLSSNSNSENIQFSAEEVEFILDLLPPPNVDPDLKIIREKFQQFLGNLRNLA